MFDAFIQCQLPDLFDDGIDAVLDVLQGEVGATGISVPVAVPPLAYLRRSQTEAPRILRSRGGLFFHADDGRYAHTRVKPITADWLKGRDPLNQVVERCRARGMALWLEVSATLTGRVAVRYPEASVKSVYGGASPFRLCPVNPDVAEWLRGMVAELSARFAPAGIVLEDFHGGRIGSGVSDLSNAQVGGRGAAQLLAVCFCESCRQTATRAEVDVAAAARVVQVRLAEALSGPAPINTPLTAIVNSLDGPPFLRDYLDAQRAALKRVLSELARGGDTLICARYDDEVWPLGLAGAPIVPLQSSATGDARAANLTVESAAALLRNGRPACVRLTIADCARDEPPLIVRTLTQLAELGVRAVELVHYGLASRADLSIAKQAIRFARRTAGS